MPKRYSELGPELIEEALCLVDEGKTDTEISKIIGLGTHHLRRIRDDHDRPRSRQWANTHTIEQMNDVIDMIREGSTLTEIASQTGISKRKIKQWREEEIREGNPLPEFLLQSIKSEQWRNGFSDEEIIELTILNQGFGIIRFSKELNISMAPLLQLFTDFKEHFGEDLYDYLNDIPLISEEEYINNYGKIPDRIRDRKKAYRDEGGVYNVLYPSPEPDFNWGVYQRSDEFHQLHDEEPEEHSRLSHIENSVQIWVNAMLDSKGYIQQQEHRGEFVELFEFGSEDWTFNKWMKHCGLLFDRLTGRWYKEGKFPKLSEQIEQLSATSTKKRGRPPSSIKEKMSKRSPANLAADIEMRENKRNLTGPRSPLYSGKSGGASRGESLDRILERRQLAHSSQFSSEEE